MFDKIFKIRYVEVPPCPRCSSHRTGFYMYSVDGVVSNLLIQKKYLKSGQRVRVTNYSCAEMGKNVFCDKCGIEWMAQLKTKYVTKSELALLMSDKEVSLEDIEKKYKKGEGTDIFGKKKKKPILKRVAGSILNSIQRRAGDDGENIDDDDDEDDEYIEYSTNVGTVNSEINNYDDYNYNDRKSDSFVSNERIVRNNDLKAENVEENIKSNTENDDAKYHRYRVINKSDEE